MELPAKAASAERVRSDAQIQDTLDDALADSFPASDPVSIVTSQHEEAWQKDEGVAEPERPARDLPTSG